MYGIESESPTSLITGPGTCGPRPGIVVFSHLRWNFVWQRPQQFLSRFAAHQPVLFVEEPVIDLPEGHDPWLEMGTAAPSVTVAKVHLAALMNDSPKRGLELRRFTRMAIEASNGTSRFNSPLLWYYTPLDALWSLGHFENCGIVYDCMDELSQFKNAPPRLLEAERQLLKVADIVFTGGYELWRAKREQHPNVHFFGCGVEADHFGQARHDKTTVPADVRDLQGPVLGWFGVVDERMDCELIRRIAELRPEWSMAMIGPVVKIDPADLPKARNIHWLGARGYKELPAYCKGFDVCMMPFALNEATQYINPTKALEYMATGKPVISTPVADVVHQYANIIYVEKDAEGFVARIEEVLANPDAERRDRGLARASSSSWDSTVSRMQALIAEIDGNVIDLNQKVTLK